MYKKLPQSVSPPVPFSLILSLSLSLILAFNLSFASPSLSSHECSVVSPSQRSHLRCHFSGVKAEHFLNGEITCVSPGSPLSAAPPLSALTHTHTHTQRAVKSPSLGCRLTLSCLVKTTARCSECRCLKSWAHQTDGFTGVTPWWPPGALVQRWYQAPAPLPLAQEQEALAHTGEDWDSFHTTSLSVCAGHREVAGSGHIFCRLHYRTHQRKYDLNL